MDLFKGVKLTSTDIVHTCSVKLYLVIFITIFLSKTTL